MFQNFKNWLNKSLDTLAQPPPIKQNIEDTNNTQSSSPKIDKSSPITEIKNETSPNTSTNPPKINLKQEWELLKTSFKEDVTMVNEKLKTKVSIPNDLYNDVYTPSGSSLLLRMESQIGQMKSNVSSQCKIAEESRLVILKMINYSFKELEVFLALKKQMEFLPSLSEEIGYAEKSLEDVCSKIEKVEEIFTQKLKDRQKNRFENWNNSISIEVTQERANAGTRLYNLEKSLIEKKRVENEKSVFNQNKILESFKNTFNQQVEQYKKFGLLPTKEKKENPTVESVDNVDVSETLVEEQGELEDFLASEEEEDEEEEDEEEDEDEVETTQKPEGEKINEMVDKKEN